MAKCVTENKTMVLRFYFAFLFFPNLVCHSNVIHIIIETVQNTKSYINFIADLKS